MQVSATSLSTVQDKWGFLIPLTPPPPPLTRGQKITAFFARIRRTIYYNKTARTVPIGTSIGLMITKIAQSQVLTYLSQALNSAAKETVVPTGGDLSNSRQFLNIAGPVRVLGMSISGGLSIYDIIAQAIEISDEVKKGRWEEGVDAVLGMINGCSTLCDSLSSASLGISMANPAALPAIWAWAMPLGVAGAVVTATTIIFLNYRGIQQSKEIIKKIDNSLADIFSADKRSATLEEHTTGEHALDWLRSELTDSVNKDGEFYLKRNFDIINREKYGAQVLHIIDKHDHTDKKDLLKAFKARSIDKILSHKLAIAAAIIGLIGVMIFFWPVIAPAVVGFGIVALSGLIGVVRYVKDYKSVKRLEKEIDKICSFEKLADNEYEWVEKYAPYAVELCKDYKESKKAAQEPKAEHIETHKKHKKHKKKKPRMTCDLPLKA